LTNPIKMTQILDVAKQNTAIDSSLDLLSFAQQASNLTGGNVTYYTLPIDHFGKDPLGEDVNFVNLSLIQATVSHLLAPPTSVAAAPVKPHPSSSSKVVHVVVDIVNSSGRPGLAGQLEHTLTTSGFSVGKASTGPTLVPASVIEFGAGADASAFKLASALGGLPTQRTAGLPIGAVRVVIGTDFTLPSGLAAGGSSSSPSTPAPAKPVRGGGPGVTAPPPTALSVLSGGGIQCVK
jgi:hypothetical protein